MRQTSDRSDRCEEIAYVLLEEARLRCLPLLGDERDCEPDLDRLSLNGLYRDLGIAGYYASSHLEPPRRRQLLAEAHRRSEPRSDSFDDAGLDDTVRALVDVIADATRAVEHALARTGLSDHMHLSHIHVLSACEALDAILALPA